MRDDRHLMDEGFRRTMRRVSLALRRAAAEEDDELAAHFIEGLADAAMVATLPDAPASGLIRIMALPPEQPGEAA